MKTHYSFFFIALLSLSSINAQITDFGIYLEPSPPALPAAGNTFTDPVFNTTLLRVTDASDGTDNHHAYAYWPAMNMNSTHLYILQTDIGATLYDFDPVSFAISNKRVAFTFACPSGSQPSLEDAIWSDVDPNIIFVHDQLMHLYAYNVSTQTYALVKDLSTPLPLGAHSGQMNKNHTNDDLFSFTWKDNAWAVVGFLTWRSSTDQFNFGAQNNLDECQPDRAGDYLIIKLGTSGATVVQARILNLTTSVFTDITDGGPGSSSTPGLFWAPGHGDMGNGTVLGHDDWNNRLVGRTAANPSAFYSVLDMNSDWSQDYHASHLADDMNWITLSAYVSNTLPNSGLFKNELFQVSTDGLQSVRRLAHHHSDFLSDYAVNGGGMAYWSSPKSCISKDGNWIVFTSNWGSTSRKDVFILKNPTVATSVVNTNFENSIQLFPNPSNGKFNISSTEKIISFSITDMLGRVIMFQDKQTNEFNISEKGVYLLNIKLENGILKTFKIVKQ